MEIAAVTLQTGRFQRQLPSARKAGAREASNVEAGSEHKSGNGAAHHATGGEGQAYWLACNRPIVPAANPGLLRHCCLEGANAPYSRQ